MRLDLLGGIEVMRFAEPSGRIVQAEVRIGDSVISLTEQDGNCNRSPHALGGLPLLLTIAVEDADAVGRAMVAHGATRYWVRSLPVAKHSFCDVFACWRLGTVDFAEGTNAHKQRSD
jgi:hypothetical protein